MRKFILFMVMIMAGAVMGQQMYKDFPVRRDRPLVVVLGGGHAAVTAVETAQACGWQAVLVDSHNHAGGMLASSNHSWLLNGTTGMSVPRPCGTMKKEFFARVMDSGGYPLLMSHCAGVLKGGRSAAGVAIACKWGTFALRADAVIDASEEQVAARHLQGLPDKWRQTVESIFEIGGAQSITDITLDALKLENISWHRTIKEGAVSISTFHTETATADWLEPSRREMEARYAMAKLLQRIRKECLGLEHAILLRFGERRVVTEEWPLPSIASFVRIPAQLPIQPTTNDVRKLEYATVETVKNFLQIALGTSAYGESMSLMSMGRFTYFKQTAADGCLLQPITLETDATASYDVLVAGGGTGGSAVMTALAERKIKALTVDLMPFLGGTTTAGGVSGAWHGYTQGAYGKIAAERQKQARSESAVPFFGSVRYWDKLFRIAENQQSFVGNAVVCGATVQDGRMTSALVYNECGFRRIVAKVYVDTTGDADLCAQAGVPTKLGDDDYGWIQSSSCWGSDPWKGKTFQDSHYSNDLDVVDPTDHADAIRGLALAHRRNSDYHISSLFTQRESRRIIGYDYLTVRDIIMRKFRPDAIAVSCCQFDTHGRGTYEMSHFFTKDTKNATDGEIHVLMPLGAYRPKDTANLLVASKAISGERDATTLCRMNPEVTNGGYAVGVAATQFVTRGLTTLNDIDIMALRSELHELGVLPDWAMTPDEPEWTMDYAVRKLSEVGGQLPALLMPKEQIVPILKARLLDVSADILPKIAEDLAWFGCADGQEIMLKRLRDFMKKDMAKVEDTGHNTFVVTDVNGVEFKGEGANNYGFLQIGSVVPGRAYGSINSLLYRLARLDTPETMAPVLELAERATAISDSLRTGTTPYAIARTDSVVTYGHERLWALATFFRKRPTPQAIPALTRLLQTKHIGGNVCHEPWRDVPYFQMTYLEIALADALRACGGELGTQRLQEFSTDSRAIFRKMAQRCLQTKDN